MIIFRTDVSLKIGTGHVVRCLSLAKELRRKGKRCIFICRDNKDDLFGVIKDEKFELILLPILKDKKKNNNLKSNNKKLKHDSWLDKGWKKDAEETINVIGKKKIDWLIVDHYGIDQRWEKKLKVSVKKIMVIDDLADRKHICDILLDQNLTSDFKKKYSTLVPKYCEILLGPKYALLSSEYNDLFYSTPTRKGPIKNILIYFGGSDHNRLNELTLDALISLKRKDIIFNFVVSPRYLNKGKIYEISKKNKNINIFSNLKSLAFLILKADIAIGASGVNAWERCCLGLPSVVITIADHQKSIAKELHKKKLIYWVGHFTKVTKKSIKDSLIKVFKTNLEKWSESCKEVTNGLGIKKVTSLITFDQKFNFIVRRFRIEDKDFLIQFPKLRIMFETGNKIDLSLNYYLRNQDRHKMYVIETNEGLPVCIYYFKLNNNIWSMFDNQIKFFQNLKYEQEFFKIVLNKFKSEYDEKISLINEKTKIKFKKNRLSISICTSKSSWINQSIPHLINDLIKMGHKCCWVHNAYQLQKGDVCFYLSYEKIVEKSIRKRFNNNLIVHESDLPKGKGWSPLSWQILEGKKLIPFTLIEAADEVDSGKIYAQKWEQLNGFELLDELHNIQAKATYQICKQFINNISSSIKKGQPQKGNESFYHRRRPIHSKLDINKSIKEQFNLLRIVDNKRYPAYFEIKKRKFYLQIKSEK